MEDFGFILINKKIGPTSHDVIDELRRITGIRKIGHAGTLDPLASGLLICAIGRGATRQISRLVKEDKEYEAEIMLGAETDTYDRMGEIVKTYDRKIKDEKEILDTLAEFVGEQDQLPPIYSAKKIKGKKMYELARAGKEVKIEPSRVRIDEVKLIDFAWPKLTIKVACGSGTYIRSLAYDIGRALNVGGYIENLKRTRVGAYFLDNAVSLDELTSDNWSDYLFKLDLDKTE